MPEVSAIAGSRMMYSSWKPKREPGVLFRHIPCDLCGADDVDRLGKPKISQKIENMIPIPEHVSVVRCRHCGFYYTDPMPSWREEDLQNIYDSEYFPKMTRWWKQAKTKVNPQRRLDVMEQHATLRISSFLEVGCGLGYGLEEAMRRGWVAYGQEVSQFFAEQVKERLGLEVFLGQLEQAYYPESFFDAIYVDSVLEHLQQPMKMLKEIHRILKRGGVGYITVTNEHALINEFWSLVLRLTQPERCPILSPFAYPVHLVGFTKDTFRRACQNAEFDISTISVCAGTNEWRKYKIRDIAYLMLNLMCFPIYVTGEIMGKGIAIEAVIAPRK